MSKYYKLSGSNGYCGCDFEEYIEDEVENLTEDDLYEMAREYSNDNAYSYEYLATEDICREDYETDTEYDEGIEDAIQWYWDGVFYGVDEITEEEYKQQ